MITAMPETDFCKIIDIKDCEVGKYSSCICTKVMVFGKDQINGKICERFTTHTTSRNCNDGNFQLTNLCMASSAAAPCETILFDKDQRIDELQKENELLKNKLKEIYDELDHHLEL